MSGIYQARLYESNSNPQRLAALECLKDLSIEKTDHILDIGCGDGKTTSYLSQLVPQGQVVGLDISDKMIQLAALQHQNENLRFLVGDGEQPFFSQSFDKLILFGSFHWIQDQQKALHSYENLLKPHGKILIVTPLKHPSNVGAIFDKLIQKEKWAPLFLNRKSFKHYFDEKEIKVLLSSANLIAEQVEVKEMDVSFDSVDAFRNWVTPLLTPIKHLSSENQKSFVEDVMEEIFKVYPLSPDRSLTAKYYVLNVIAAKPPC